MRRLPPDSIPNRLRALRFANFARNAMPFWIWPLMTAPLAAHNAWWLLVLALLTAASLLHLVPFGRQTLLRKLAALQRRLPWFQQQAVTFCTPEQLPDLRAALTTEVVDCEELDGRGMHDTDSLLAAIERRFGARTFPAEPFERAVAILGKDVPGQQIRAIIWHAADELARSDVASLVTLLRGIDNLVGATRCTLVLFVVAERPRVDRSHGGASPSRHERADAESARAALTDAPDGAWWQPKPGEMAR